MPSFSAYSANSFAMPRPYVSLVVEDEDLLQPELVRVLRVRGALELVVPDDARVVPCPARVVVVRLPRLGAGATLGQARIRVRRADHRERLARFATGITSLAQPELNVPMTPMTLSLFAYARAFDEHFAESQTPAWAVESSQDW